MDTPIKPDNAMIMLYGVGYVFKFEFLPDESEEARQEAEFSCGGGYYEWDSVYRITGTGIDPQGRCVRKVEKPVTVICLESKWNRYMEYKPSEYGCWRLKSEYQKQVEAWNKFLATEARNKANYKRLYEKFQGAHPDEL